MVKEGEYGGCIFVFMYENRIVKLFYFTVEIAVRSGG
jgi:hypothetical protein